MTNNNLNKELNNIVDYLQNEIAVYTVSEVAKIIKTNEAYVRELIKSQLLHSMKMGRLKVSSFELARFIQENKGMDLSDPFNPQKLEWENLQ